jgi:hypothetical protein
MKQKMKAREQILQAAVLERGWTTDPGYNGIGAHFTDGWSGHAPDERGLHVEFSSRGGITYASYGMGRQAGVHRWHRMSGPGQLEQVLAYIAQEQVPTCVSCGHLVTECDDYPEKHR